EEKLPVDAEAEEYRRGPVAHVPLAPIAERETRKVLGTVAGGPGVSVAVERDVVDPAFRNDRRAAARASLHQQLADAGQIAHRRAYAARAARGAQAIHRDVGAARGAEGPPEQLGHQICISLAGRALDDPAEQVGVRRDVVEGPAVWPRRFRQLAIERA